MQSFYGNQQPAPQTIQTPNGPVEVLQPTNDIMQFSPGGMLQGQIGQLWAMVEALLTRAPWWLLVVGGAVAGQWLFANNKLRLFK